MVLFPLDNPILQARQRKTSAFGAPAAVAVIDAGKSIRPLSQSRKNPFAKKTSDDSSSATPSPRGLAAFDQPKVTQTKPTTTGPSKENVKAKATKQPTLFGMKKAAKDSSPAPAQEMSSESQDPLPSPAQPPKTGFLLWFDQNRSQFMSDNPECNEAELVRLGAQKFKSLSEEERQVGYSSKFTYLITIIWVFPAYRNTTGNGSRREMPNSRKKLSKRRDPPLPKDFLLSKPKLQFLIFLEIISLV